MVSTRHLPQNKRYTQTKSKWMEKDTVHANEKEKRNWGVNTYSVKIDFKTKATVRDKEEHYMAIQQEHITF